MKAICFGTSGVRHFADSSMQRNNHPFFLPDTNSGREAVVCPAIRISRLGTHISEKFAFRYFDSFMPACMFFPSDFGEGMMQIPEKYFIADSMFCIGESVECVDKETVHTISTGTEDKLTFSADRLNVSKAIAMISEYATLKMGDIIIFTDYHNTLPISENDHVIVEIDDIVSIDVKIK